MTAEECLLCSLFAMVSSDCHVRNVRARTTGLGMLPSETSSAEKIWNLHVCWTPRSHIQSCTTCGLCSGATICHKRLHQKRKCDNHEKKSCTLYGFLVRNSFSNCHFMHKTACNGLHYSTYHREQKKMCLQVLLQHVILKVTQGS